MPTLTHTGGAADDPQPKPAAPGSIRGGGAKSSAVASNRNGSSRPNPNDAVNTTSSNSSNTNNNASRPKSSSPSSSSVRSPAPPPNVPEVQLKLWRAVLHRRKNQIRRLPPSHLHSFANDLVSDIVSSRYETNEYCKDKENRSDGAQLDLVDGHYSTHLLIEQPPTNETNSDNVGGLSAEQIGLHLLALFYRSVDERLSHAMRKHGIDSLRRACSRLEYWLGKHQESLKGIKRKSATDDNGTKSTTGDASNENNNENQSKKKPRRDSSSAQSIQSQGGGSNASSQKARDDNKGKRKKQKRSSTDSRDDGSDKSMRKAPPELLVAAAAGLTPNQQRRKVSDADREGGNGNPEKKGGGREPLAEPHKSNDKQSESSQQNYTLAATTAQKMPLRETAIEKNKVNYNSVQELSADDSNQLARTQKKPHENARDNLPQKPGDNPEKKGGGREALAEPHAPSQQQKGLHQSNDKKSERASSQQNHILAATAAQKMPLSDTATETNKVNDNSVQELSADGSNQLARTQKKPQENARDNLPQQPAAAQQRMNNKNVQHQSTAAVQNKDQEQGESQLCTFFMQGVCNRGTSCAFRHDTAHVKPVRNEGAASDSGTKNSGGIGNRFMPPENRAVGAHIWSPPASPDKAKRKDLVVQGDKDARAKDKPSSSQAATQRTVDLAPQRESATSAANKPQQREAPKPNQQKLAAPTATEGSSLLPQSKQGRIENSLVTKERLSIPPSSLTPTAQSANNKDSQSRPTSDAQSQSPQKDPPRPKPNPNNRWGPKATETAAVPVSMPSQSEKEHQPSNATPNDTASQRRNSKESRLGETVSQRKDPPDLNPANAEASKGTDEAASVAGIPFQPKETQTNEPQPEQARQGEKDKANEIHIQQKNCNDRQGAVANSMHTNKERSGSSCSKTVTSHASQASFTSQDTQQISNKKAVEPADDDVIDLCSSDDDDDSLRPTPSIKVATLSTANPPTKKEQNDEEPRLASSFVPPPPPSPPASPVPPATIHNPAPAPRPKPKTFSDMRVLPFYADNASPLVSGSLNARASCTVRFDSGYHLDGSGSCLNDALRRDACERFKAWDPYWRVVEELGSRSFGNTRGGTRTTSCQQAQRGVPVIPECPSSCASLFINLPSDVIKLKSASTDSSGRNVLNFRPWGVNWGLAADPKNHKTKDRRLLIRMIPLQRTSKDKKKRPDGHLWPKGTFVQLKRGNAEEVLKIVQRKQQSHAPTEWKGMCRSLDLSQHLINTKLPIEVKFCSKEVIENSVNKDGHVPETLSGSYAVQIAVCEYVDADDLYDQLMGNVQGEVSIPKISLRSAKKMAKEYMAGQVVSMIDSDDEDDNVESNQGSHERKSLTFSLLCPISKTAMCTPVRGRNCTHLQCFDLKNYLHANKSITGNRWRCGICESFVNVRELVNCGLFQAMINTVGKNVSSARDQVTLSFDGTFVLKEPNKLRYASKTATKTEANNEVIELL